MKKQYAGLSELRREYGHHKKIPQRYEEVILKALSHYPELKNTHIQFQLKDEHPVPYGTSPAPLGFFFSKNRQYVITLREEAGPPTRQALFKNLPEEAQRAVIGHELGHVLQYERKSGPALAAFTMSYAMASKRREIEREADLMAIEHGLGFELYVHAVYIRRIPGYVQQRKNLDVDYLKPQEILDILPEDSPAV